MSCSQKDIITPNVHFKAQVFGTGFISQSLWIILKVHLKDHFKQVFNIHSCLILNAFFPGENALLPHRCTFKDSLLKGKKWKHSAEYIDRSTHAYKSRTFLNERSEHIFGSTLRKHITGLWKESSTQKENCWWTAFFSTLGPTMLSLRDLIWTNICSWWANYLLSAVLLQSPSGKYHFKAPKSRQMQHRALWGREMGVARTFFCYLNVALPFGQKLGGGNSFFTLPGSFFQLV